MSEVLLLEENYYTSYTSTTTRISYWLKHAETGVQDFLCILYINFIEHKRRRNFSEFLNLHIIATALLAFFYHGFRTKLEKIYQNKIIPIHFIHKQKTYKSKHN